MRHKQFSFQKCSPEQKKKSLGITALVQSFSRVIPVRIHILKLPSFHFWVLITFIFFYRSIEAKINFISYYFAWWAPILKLCCQKATHHINCSWELGNKFQNEVHVIAFVPKIPLDDLDLRDEPGCNVSLDTEELSTIIEANAETTTYALKVKHLAQNCKIKKIADVCDLWWSAAHTQFLILAWIFIVYLQLLKSGFCMMINKSIFLWIKKPAPHSINNPHCHQRSFWPSRHFFFFFFLCKRKYKEVIYYKFSSNRSVHHIMITLSEFWNHSGLVANCRAYQTLPIN